MDRIKEKIIKDFMNTNSITHEDIVNASNISDPENRIVLNHRVVKLLNRDTLKEEYPSSSNGSIEDKDDDKLLSLVPFNFEEVNKINDIRFKGNADLQKKYCDLLEIDNISTTVLYGDISGKGIIDLSNLDNYKDLKAENLNQLEIKIKESENDKEKKVGTIPNGKNILSASFIVHNNEVKENNKSKSSEETNTNSNTSNSLNIKINIDSNLNKSVLDNYIKSVEDYLAVLKYYKNHSNSLNEESTSASITKEIELLLLKNFINYSNWKTKYTGDLQKWNIQSLIPFAIYLRDKLVNEQIILNNLKYFLDNGSRIYDTSFPYFNLINLIDDESLLEIDDKLTSSCKENINNLYNIYTSYINNINENLAIIKNYNDIIKKDHNGDLKIIQNNKNAQNKFDDVCDHLTLQLGHTESHLISYLLFGQRKFDFKTQYKDLHLYIKNTKYKDDLKNYLKEEVIKKSNCGLSHKNAVITLQIKSVRHCCTMCKSNIQNLKEEIDSALNKLGFKGTFNIAFYYQEDKEKKKEKKKEIKKSNSLPNYSGKKGIAQEIIISKRTYSNFKKNINNLEEYTIAKYLSIEKQREKIKGKENKIIQKEGEKKKTKKELYIETEQKVLSSIGKSLSKSKTNNTKSNLNKVSILQLSTSLNLFFEAFKKNCKNKEVLEEFNEIQQKIWKDSKSNSKYIEIKQKKLIKQSENIFISGALSSNKKSSN